MEAFLAGGGQQSVFEYSLGGVFRQLQVVYAGVDGREAVIVTVHLAYHSQTRLKVGQATRGQRRAAGGELEESFPLISVHVD